ncbi:MAG: MBL fold metallo-hydrolase [Granulosicoccus sp.]
MSAKPHLIKPVFDGKRFSYPDNTPQGSRWDVLRWALTRKPARWPKDLQNPVADPVVSEVSGENLRITFINHATVLIQCNSINVITDPVFSKRVSPVKFAGPARHRAAGLTVSQLPQIHAVLISHTHYDHLDTRSIATICERDNPLIVAPLNNARAINKATACHVAELSWWEQQTIGESIQVALVPARHWTSRMPGDENKALWGGFVLKFPGAPVYFAGDTGYGDGRHFTQAREQYGRFRCALLPIGAYQPRWFMKPQHMNPAEAVRAFRDLQATYALGIHHGTFQLTDEPYDAPLKDLEIALANQSVNPQQFRTLDNGRAWNIPALSDNTFSE